MALGFSGKMERMFKLDGDVCDSPVDKMMVEVEGDGGEGKRIWVREGSFVGCEKRLGLTLFLLLLRRRKNRGLRERGFWFGE